MNELGHTIAIAWNELQVLWKDKGSLAIVFLLPLLLASVFGGNLAAARSSFEEGGEEPAFTLDVFLVNQDAGPYGAQIASALREIEILNVRRIGSAERADGLIVEGEAVAAIVVPEDFSQKVDAYEPSELLVIIDPTQPESAGIVTGVMNNIIDGVTLWGEISYGVRTVMTESGVLDGATLDQVRAAGAQTTGVIMTQLSEMRQNPAIVVESGDLSSEEPPVDFINSLFAALMPGFAVMFAFFLVPVITGSLFLEKESGSFRRLMAAPVHRGSVLAGKMLAYLLVVAMQVLVLFALGSIFGMSIGDVPGIILVTVALGLSVTAMGMLVAALARNRKQADSIGTLLGFALGGISGCVPVGALLLAFRNEGILGNLARLTPHGHALEGFFRLLAENAGVVEVLPQAGILAGFALLFYVLAIWRFKFE